jgi:hypothetical protein
MGIFSGHASLQNVPEKKAKAVPEFGYCEAA